jgi:hypothetical protein
MDAAMRNVKTPIQYLRVLAVGDQLPRVSRRVVDRAGLDSSRDAVQIQSPRWASKNEPPRWARQPRGPLLKHHGCISVICIVVGASGWRPPSSTASGQDTLNAPGVDSIM